MHQIFKINGFVLHKNKGCSKFQSQVNIGLSIAYYSLYMTIESSWNLHKNNLNKIHTYKDIMHLILLYFNAYNSCKSFFKIMRVQDFM